MTDKFYKENGNTAFVMGMVLLGVSASMGEQTGFALNPARDLAPRVFTSMIGYGSKVWNFPEGNIHYGGRNVAYWWIPVVGPIIGAVLGGFV